MLASVQLITEKQPIEGADFIEKVKVLGWWTVAKKGEFQVGDKCVFFEIDSILPERPEFSFMEKYKYRVRPIKIRGVICQGLAMPLSILGRDAEVGEDVTEELSVKKYEKPPAFKESSVIGVFPSHLVPITDEPNLLSHPEVLDEMRGMDIVITEKVDGTSATYFWHPITGEFWVCSRRCRIKPENTNPYGFIAEKYNLPERLPQGYALQGEICGPKIQGNPLNLPFPHIFIFDIWDIEKQRYLSFDGMNSFVTTFLGDLGHPSSLTVPIIDIIHDFNWDIEYIFEYVKNLGENKEGIVLRPAEVKFSKELNRRLSVKVVNPLYKNI